MRLFVSLVGERANACRSRSTSGLLEAQSDAEGALTRIDEALALQVRQENTEAVLSCIACAARFCAIRERVAGRGSISQRYRRCTAPEDQDL
jgi:hypothetical protein